MCPVDGGIIDRPQEALCIHVSSLLSSVCYFLFQSPLPNNQGRQRRKPCLNRVQLQNRQTSLLWPHPRIRQWLRRAAFGSVRTACGLYLGPTPDGRWDKKHSGGGKIGGDINGYQRNKRRS